jgi:hypothetical protein
MAARENTLWIQSGQSAFRIIDTIANNRSPMTEGSTTNL